MVQRYAAAPAEPTDPGDVAGALGPGARLAPPLRADMERRFGTDFGGVRVHDDPQAHANAAALQAHAYTAGHDIAFAAGRYAPSSPGGRRLLAHELAHVVQQRRGGAAPALDAGAPHERAADRAADRAAAGDAPVAVEGATAVGIARDAAGGHPDRYLVAFLGNRAWFWGSVGPTPPGWPDDDKLRALWQATGVSPKKGQVGPADDNTMAHKPSFIEFADTVRAFQIQTMGRHGAAASGVVDPKTAQRLRAAAPAAAPEQAAAGEAAPAASEMETAAQSGVEAAGEHVTAASAAGAETHSALLDRVKRALVDALLTSVGIPPTGARLAAAVGRGMGDELVHELIHEGKGAVLLGHIATMGPSGAAQLAKGYYIGLVEGLVSPLTDLFGLAVFGEHMRNLAFELLASAFNAHGKIGKEVHELLDDADKVKKGLGEMWQHFKDDPKTALKTLLSLPDAINAYAEKKAYELGKTGASQIVSGLEAPWSGKKQEPEASPSPLTSPLAWVESKAKRAESWALDTPWSQIGSKIGYAIGFVAIQVILIAFTEGIGNAVEQVAAWLGKLAGVLGKLGEAAGAAASRVAELVGMLGKAIGAVEEGIGLLAEKALKPLKKFLDPVLEPLGDLFASLRKFLRKLLGAAEKESPQLVETTAAKAAGAADEGAKVVPKPPPEAEVKTPTPPETKSPVKTGGAGEPPVTTAKPPPKESVPAQTGAAQAGAGATRELETIEARVERLEYVRLPKAERDAMRKATAKVRELAHKDPAAAERLLDELEARFFPHGPPGTASEVGQDVAAAQSKLYPEKGAGGTYRQSAATDERALQDQPRPDRGRIKQAVNKESEQLGEAGGRALAEKEKITVLEWNTPQKWKGEFGRGIDALGERGEKTVIIEFKYGGSRLGESGGVVQMSNEWVGRKIAELEAVGDTETAAKLLKAAQEGKLQGVVYWTRDLKAGETTSRLQAFQLRGKLPTENISESGLIQYAPTKVEKAYAARLKALRDAIARGDLKGLRNL